MSMFSCSRTCGLLLLACLAGCATQPPELPVLTTQTPEQMVAAIRAAAGDGEDELAVQPLRDPQVEDLRQSAQQLEAQKRYADAAQALDQALAIVSDDPALLQERAEIALLQKDFPGAGKLAERAYGLGSKVGPLCRRHWATIEQVRLVHGDATGAADAKTQIAACKVAAPDRF
jgi:Flp pilus assembly protein TadD